MVQITAKQWILQNYATFDSDVNLNYGTPEATFKLIEKTYDTEDPNLLPEGHLLVQSIYISNDPAQKGWFGEHDSYVKAVPLGSVAPAQGVAKVIKSNHKDFAEGDLITGRLTGWATYNVIDGNGFVRKIDPTKLPLVKYLSAFGTTMLTSYFNAFHYSGVKPEDEGKVWLVTGAAGAAGSSLVSLVAHLMKPKKIIAVAGGEEKRKWVETLGDKIVCLDYKSESYKEDFVKALDGENIDVFIDHVAGELLNHALPYMRVHGKVVQVGAIASYNNAGSFNFPSYSTVITKRLTIQGMVVIDNIGEMGKAIADLTEWFSTGKLDINKVHETVVQAQGDDFEKVPELWTGLFKGANKGKYITQIAEWN